MLTEEQIKAIDAIGPMGTMQTARLLGISERTLKKRARDGQIRHQRSSANRWLFWPADYLARLDKIHLKK
jgi:hypothetical protein